MASSEMDGGVSREDLLQRVELMEQMIAEGRRSTTRCGWIFLLWGVVDLAAMSWLHFLPHSHWVGVRAWPTCLIAGAILTCIGLAVQRRRERLGLRVSCCRVGMVWFMLGIALTIFISGAMVNHLSWQSSYIAALLIFVGLAHAISAAILQWRGQGVVAGIWWLGGGAVFFARSQGTVNAIMFAEMCVGMILFGVYAMVLDARSGGNRGRNDG